MESLVRAIAEGSWPLWNPYMGFGAPMLADASYQILYPLTWLNLILAPATYYKVLVVTHTALAGIGAFRLGRRQGLREWPAFAAASLWASSGPFLSTAALYHHFVSASWMPWVMLGVETALEAPGARAAARLGLTAAAQLLGGSGDLCLMTAIAAALRALSYLFSLRPSIPQALRIASFGVLAAVLAFAVASAQWIPTLTQAQSSSRMQMASEARSYWSLSPVAALDLVFPRLVADAPLSPSARASLYEGREPFLSCLYLGVASVPLVVLGGLARGAQRAWLLLGVLLFLALALGRSDPLYPELARVPPFSLVRYPVKYLLPFTLLWCLLAGRGLQDWLAPTARRFSLIAALLVGLGITATSGRACLLLASGGSVSSALLAGLSGPSAEAQASFAAGALRSFVGTLIVSAVVSALMLARLRSTGVARATALAAALVAVADVARVGRTINPTAPAALLDHAPPVAGRLRSAAPEPRIFVLPAERERMISQLARGPAGWDAEPRWSLGLLDLLQPPSAARYGIFGSYDGDFTGLAPAPTGELRGLLARFKDTPAGIRILRLGSVDYVVALGHSSFDALPEVGPAIDSVFREPIRLLRVPDPLPRFYAVDRAWVAAEPASYAALVAPTFDLTHDVILAPPAPEASGTASFVGRVRLLERRMDRIVLEADLSSPGFVLLVEAFDAGWRAWLDDQPAPVLRANVLFRAVPVPAGRHRVALAYRPRAVTRGAALSVASLAVAVGLALRRQR